MGAKKISALTSASTPLTGAETTAGVQDGVTVKWTVDDVSDFVFDRVGWRTLESFGVVEGGAANPSTNSALIETALASGYKIELAHGATYYIGRRVVVPSGAVMVGDGTPTFYMPAASFTNTDPTITGRYGSTAVGFDCSGQTTTPFAANSNILLEGFRVQSQVADGRALRGIVALNVANLKVRNIELFGFPLGVGVCVASITGDSEIADIYAHDFTSNIDWTGVTAVPQITAIEVDNDRINSVPSVGLRIIRPRIKDITVGATFFAASGYQTDGINICHYTTDGVSITDAWIKNVGEGIDNFGARTQIIGGQFLDCQVYGLKFINGATHSRAVAPIIKGAGLAGVVFAGSNATGDTADNVVLSPDISGIGFNGTFSANDTACVAIIDNGGGTGKPYRNQVVGGTLDASGGGKHVLTDSSNGADNVLRGHHAVDGSAARYQIVHGATRIEPVIKTSVKAYTNAAQTPASATATKITLDTATTDRRTEFNSSTNRVTVIDPGEYRIKGQIRVPTITSGSTLKLDIKVNGVSVAARLVTISGTSEAYIDVSTTASLAAGDYIELWFTNSDATPRLLTSGGVAAALSFLTVEMV